ncbi:MAG TPA: hypothetical protein VGJ66_02390 [Pyrinomonadaceae bacterium]
MTTFRVIIVIGALVAVTETVASALWLPLYFRHGIRLYSRQLAVRLPGTAPDLMDIVSCSTTGLCFHRLSPQDIAFREPLITFTRVPLMHGRMNYDGSRLHVRGLVNWTIVVIGILFVALGIVFVLHAPIYASLMLVIFGGLLLWSYDVQRQRFNDLVVEVTAQLSARPNERLERTI